MQEIREDYKLKSHEMVTILPPKNIKQNSM